jgi:hypothetical protein
MAIQVKRAWLDNQRELAWVLYQCDKSGWITDKAAFFEAMAQIYA